MQIEISDKQFINTDIIMDIGPIQMSTLGGVQYSCFFVKSSDGTMEEVGDNSFPETEKKRQILLDAVNGKGDGSADLKKEEPFNETNIPIMKDQDIRKICYECIKSVEDSRVDEGEVEQINEDRIRQIVDERICELYASTKEEPEPDSDPEPDDKRTREWREWKERQDKTT